MMAPILVVGHQPARAAAVAEVLVRGGLDPQQIPLLKRHFWRQLQVLPEIGTILYASCEGIPVGLMRMCDGSFTAELKLSQADPHKRSFRVVVGADVIPWQLSGFLKQIWGERAGATFIMDCSGWLPRLFDKFYRVPNGDQWNRGERGWGWL